MKPPRKSAGRDAPRSKQSPDSRPTPRRDAGPKRDNRPQPAKRGENAPKRDGQPLRGEWSAPPRHNPRRDDSRPPRRDERAPVRPPERKDPHAPQDFFVDGMSALSEYVRFKPEAILNVEATPAQMQAVERLLREHGLAMKVGELPKRDPAHGDEFAPVRARVRIQALDDEAFAERIENRATDLILALDHITDPRNLGAIVRSAAFFGVREVIAPERRQVLFTQSSVATAQGGFALTELVCVVNLSRALDELKERGYWIIGTAMDGEPYEKLVGKYEKVVLVLGSEDSGLAQKVRERCDLLTSIPNKGKGLDSLNVSVAAGIFLSAFAP